MKSQQDRVRADHDLMCDLAADLTVPLAVRKWPASGSHSPLDGALSTDTAG